MSLFKGFKNRPIKFVILTIILPEKTKNRSLNRGIYIYRGNLVLLILKNSKDQLNMRCNI